MKNNHEQIASLIADALRLAGSDFALADARSHLAMALQSVEKVAGKRGKRNEMRDFYEKQGKEKAKMWWDMVKKNAAENFDVTP